VEQQRCTCGAVLPEDARFCHKCGKPQYEEDIARLAAVETPPAPAPMREPAAARAASGISFRNSRAVLISLVVAALTFFASLLATMLWAPLFPIVLCAAGFVAARLYRSSATETLTPGAGARLGWMTGLWLFLIVALLCTIAAVYLSTPQGWEQAKAFWAQFPEMSKGLGDQHDVLATLLARLPFLFFLLTLLPGLGGMLGAKSSPRQRPSP
jgi:lysylphosphatidylglycerol synthetase-like protein (DUF2156 family)